MKNRVFFILSIICISCNNQSSQNTEALKDSAKKVITNDPISTIRTTINPKPVASFSKKIPDELNDWKFAVNIYETKETFHYLLKMQYMELRATDTLKIPNFGIAPKIEIHEGTDAYSCIIGFLDKNNSFKAYKMVIAKDDRLKVTVLHHYAVETYKAN